MKLALLGQQRFDPNLKVAAKALGVSGKVALVTAGWQGREEEDLDLSDHLGGQTVNLELHRRADEVFAQDPEFRQLYRERQLRYRQIQDFYRIRLTSLIATAKVIAHRSALPAVLEDERKTSVGAIRLLDHHHWIRCERVRHDFITECDPASRPVIARHRAEVRDVLADCAAVAIAGGHVASLLNRMHLFDVAGGIGDRPVLAWSAGAMAVTERVVVFHDYPPHGNAAPQILDAGLGLARGIVALPNPTTRLALDDEERVMMYARRSAPSTCLAFPRRSFLLLDEGRRIGAEGVVELREDGSTAKLEAA